MTASTISISAGQSAFQVLITVISSLLAHRLTWTERGTVKIAWASDRTGCELAGQVDPGLIHGHGALVLSGRAPVSTP